MNITLDGPEARACAAQLGAARVLEVIELRRGVVVRAFSHVGRVVLGSLVVTVTPKIPSNDLLELVRYAFRLDRFFDDAPFGTTGTLFQDLLVAQLVAQATRLLSRGLARTYVGRSECLTNPRARIDMGALARRMPLVDARLPCRHYLRSSDHLLNQVLAAGLLLSAEIAVDVRLRRAARRLAARLSEEVTGVTLSSSALERARNRLDRLTAAYSPILELIELLHACRGVSAEEGPPTMLPGFLFDMNRFFQMLVGRFLADHLEGCEVAEQYVLSEFMRYVPEHNPRKKRPPLPRPDFVIRAKGALWLLDAKYRDLWNEDLPADMLYQLAMYAMSQAASSTAAILYPTTSAAAMEAIIEIRDPVTKSPRGYIATRPIIIEQVLAAVRGTIDPKALARRYAFGSGAVAANA